MKKGCIGRRELLQTAGVGAASIFLGPGLAGCSDTQRLATKRSARKPAYPEACPAGRPNLVFIFADQWRAQATGYAGNKDVRTPNLDKLARESVNFSNVVSGCPVCSPYRASLMTGRYPLTHGVFLNDVRLPAEGGLDQGRHCRPGAVSIAEAYNKAGYQTGYIGKWHLDGDERSAFIPEDRRQGFKFFKALGCTHDYNNSFYYADENVKLKWQGYDAIAQSSEAQRYIREHASVEPFALFLSWGPPHEPYHTAPAKYKDLFKAEELTLRPNVPEELKDVAKKTLAGYYAHIAALDDCIGEILQTLKELGLENDTILVFTSDHGDMLYSQGQQKKQKPWDESICVPFLLRYPAVLGREGKPAVRLAGKTVDTPINTPDIMPTLLGLSGIEIPDTVEGADLSCRLVGSGRDVLRQAKELDDDAALISCPSPFGQWTRANGGREYRGIRTRRYTYVRDLNGPWLLYDNEQDPYQLNNLCNKPEHGMLQKKLESILSQKLKQTNDEFLPSWEYIKKWGYVVDESGTVRYSD
jgi:arylsulfatase A-like enzyme